jgi:putative hydrolase of the HAD superfamily
MSLDAVFLDVGNTLLYERPPRHVIYADAARARGLAVTDAGMLELMRAADRDLPQRVGGAYRYSDPWFRRFIERIFVERSGLERRALPALQDQLFARFDDPATFQLFDGTLEFLDALRDRGLKVGVISNWSERLPGVLERTGIGARLDLVLCSALEQAEKPDPALFHRALSRAQVPAERALHCGDHPLKDGLAVQVGMRAVIVDHFKRVTATDLPRVEDFDQLLTFVDGRRA